MNLFPKLPYVVNANKSGLKISFYLSNQVKYVLKQLQQAQCAKLSHCTILVKSPKPLLQFSKVFVAFLGGVFTMAQKHPSNPYPDVKFDSKG